MGVRDTRTRDDDSIQAPLVLGTCADGRDLTYCERFFEFQLDGDFAELSEVRALDRQGLIHWRHMEQRDWFNRIDPVALEYSYEKAHAALDSESSHLSPENWIRHHVRRDNSYLHGRIIEDETPAPSDSGESAEEGYGGREGIDISTQETGVTTT